MAGIAGIIKKNADIGFDSSKLNKSLEKMMKSLVYNPAQLTNSYNGGNAVFGNAVNVSAKQNDLFVKENGMPYYITIDGLVFVSDDEKAILTKKYRIHTVKNDYQYLPFLYDHYDSKFVNHLTGFFNIFIYNDRSNEMLLVNDRLGYLPLYYYNGIDYFLFASKIDSILASGLLPAIEFDETTVAEQLFFNYPLSDCTHIKNIRTLSDASVLGIVSGQINIIRYWDIGDLFGQNPLNQKDSLAVTDVAIKDSLNKILKRQSGNLNFSLTGGWDSRLLLSYLLQGFKNQLNTYSFGAPNTDDIIIPEVIAEKEGFNYIAYLLDQDYLDQHFLQNAEETIRLSNGTRNYKRSHYIYAIKQVSEVSDILITGIFGDEVFKVGRPQGNVVISRNSIKLIESGYDVEQIVQCYKESKVPDLFNVQGKTISDELRSRLFYIKERFEQYESSGQQYFAFRLLLNLRKYFGNEANSYNDFAYCFSPFVDYDFLKEFARTKFMVSRYDFETPTFRQKAESSWLYYKLTAKNNPALTYYPSSRGFSMKETNSLTGIPKILFNKFVKKRYKKSVDGFNTRTTDQLFYNLLERNNRLNENLLFRENEYTESPEEFYSLLYWASYINKNFF